MEEVRGLLLDLPGLLGLIALQVVQQPCQLAKVQQRTLNLLGIQVMAGQLRVRCKEFAPLISPQLQSPDNTLDHMWRGIAAHPIL